MFYTGWMSPTGLFIYFIYLFNIKIVHIVHKNTKEKANEMKKIKGKNTQ